MDVMTEVMTATKHYCNDCQEMGTGVPESRDYVTVRFEGWEEDFDRDEATTVRETYHTLDCGCEHSDTDDFQILREGEVFFFCGECGYPWPSDQLEDAKGCCQ